MINEERLDRIKVFVLIGGDEILGYLSEETDTQITVESPLKVINDSNTCVIIQMSLLSDNSVIIQMSLLSDNKQIVLERTGILGVMETPPEIKGKYLGYIYPDVDESDMEGEDPVNLPESDIDNVVTFGSK